MVLHGFIFFIIKLHQFYVYTQIKIYIFTNEIINVSNIFNELLIYITSFLLDILLSSDFFIACWLFVFIY